MQEYEKEDRNEKNIWMLSGVFCSRESGGQSSVYMIGNCLIFSQRSDVKRFDVITINILLKSIHSANRKNSWLIPALPKLFFADRIGI
jgi:hypothetical protein